MHPMHDTLIFFCNPPGVIVKLTMPLVLACGSHLFVPSLQNLHTLKKKMGHYNDKRNPFSDSQLPKEKGKADALLEQMNLY